MIWLTWRQFRSQAMVSLGALVGLGVVLLVTGPGLVHTYDSFLSSCTAARSCATSPDPVLTTDAPLQVLVGAITLVVPALIGMFWGAPLVSRDLETGTYRLGWTQGVTRNRWLATKLAVLGVATIGAVGLLTLMVTWWYSPLERANLNQFQEAVFGLRGIVPIGYAAFAFVLGVTLGALCRRTLPAMAGSLVAFVLARLAVTYWVRPHLLAPLHERLALTANSVGIGVSPTGVTVNAAAPDIPNAWVYSSSVVNGSGRAPSEHWLQTACPNLANNVPTLRGAAVSARGPGVTHVHIVPNRAFDACATKVAAAFHQLVVYQPADRYWAFQGLETAVFIVLAAILGACSFWWLRHRLA